MHKEVSQDVNSWHEWRRNGIGGSDAPVLMGVSPWKTPYQLWEEKAFGISEQADNSSMKRGRDLEEPARQEFEKIIGTLVAPANIVHPSLEWMRASLDGIDVHKKIVVEIKCPGKEDHALAESRKIPEKYWPQVQHQMEVAGVDQMFYFSFDGSKGVVVEVRKDQGYIDSLMETESKFWEMVKSKTPPETTERDYLCMEGMKEWEEISEEILLIKSQIKALEDEEELRKEKLKSLSQGRSAKGLILTLQKQISKGAVDYGKIPQLQGVDLDPYRKKPFDKWVTRDIRKCV